MALPRLARRRELPKVLLTGKPIWVDGEYHPTSDRVGARRPAGAHSYETVDDIVRDPGNNYVAAIGGDMHNYQRYTVRINGERDRDGETSRRIEYVVSGGAGAYMSATHRIPKIDGGDVETEDIREKRRAQVKANRNDRSLEFLRPETVEPLSEGEFHCYPRRGDSLAYYTRWFGRRLRTACLSLLVVIARGASLALDVGRDGRRAVRAWRAERVRGVRGRGRGADRLWRSHRRARDRRSHWCTPRHTGR